MIDDGKLTGSVANEVGECDGRVVVERVLSYICQISSPSERPNNLRILWATTWFVNHLVQQLKSTSFSSSNKTSSSPKPLWFP